MPLPDGTRSSTNRCVARGRVSATFARAAGGYEAARPSHERDTLPRSVDGGLPGHGLAMTADIGCSLTMSWNTSGRL